MTERKARQALVVGTGIVAQAVTARLATEGDKATAVGVAQARTALIATALDVLVICCLDESGPGSTDELAEICELGSSALVTSTASRAVVVVDARAVRGFATSPQHAALHTGAIGLARLQARRNAETGATWNLVLAGPSEHGMEVPGMVTARLAEPDEIAHAVWIAAAPFSGFITGTILAADGGLSLGH